MNNETCDNCGTKLHINGELANCPECEPQDKLKQLDSEALKIHKIIHKIRTCKENPEPPNGSDCYICDAHKHCKLDRRWVPAP